MGILKNLFGKPSAEESRAGAAALLAEARALSASDPRKAKALLLKLDSGALEPFVDFGGELHKEAAELVFQLDAALSGEASVAVPQVEVYSDPGAADWPGLVQAARANTVACSLVRFPSGFAGHRVALAGIEAQCLMGMDASMAHIVFGEGCSLTRNGLLARADEGASRNKPNKKVRELLDAVLSDHLDLDNPDEWLSPLGYQMFVYRVG